MYSHNIVYQVSHQSSEMFYLSWKIFNLHPKFYSLHTVKMTQLPPFIWMPNTKKSIWLKWYGFFEEMHWLKITLICTSSAFLWLWMDFWNESCNYNTVCSVQAVKVDIHLIPKLAKIMVKETQLSLNLWMKSKYIFTVIID